MQPINSNTGGPSILTHAIGPVRRSTSQSARIAGCHGAVIDADCGTRSARSKKPALRRVFHFRQPQFGVKHYACARATE
jgi:hypothetical protein